MSCSISRDTVDKSSQDDLLLRNLVQFYQTPEHIERIMQIISGKTNISLRIVDWFVTNYAKKYYTNYLIPMKTGIIKDVVENTKFKVYDRYKLQLKAYSKRRFDPFCRWDRISIPYKGDMHIETTLGQLNFFKWAIEHHILEHIDNNYGEIERDMNARNSGAKIGECNTECNTDEHSAGNPVGNPAGNPDTKTRKKRQELSVSACKCIKKEEVRIIVRFND